jgi:catechol 2,3-dioxygenase-like lactoylglutathione lyase family enzyme
MLLGSSAVMAFAPSTDLARSRLFYEDTLGLTVTDQNPYACVLRGEGTVIRVARVEELTPQPFTILGWIVPDMRATIRELTARGVTFTRYDGMGQDDDGVWTTPGNDQIAWFKDPDGNTLSLTQFS